MRVAVLSTGGWACTGEMAKWDGKVLREDREGRDGEVGGDSDYGFGKSGSVGVDDIGGTRVLGIAWSLVCV